MVEVLLDGKLCQLPKGYELPKEVFALDLATTAQVGKQGSARRLRLSLNSTPDVDSLMCYAADPCGGERFNAAEHSVVVRVDGVCLVRGVAQLEGLEQGPSGLRYLLSVSLGGSDWVEQASLTPLQEALEYSATLRGDTILDSWKGEKAVRFLPVCYDDYRQPYDEQSLYAPERVMTVADYYPFLSLQHLLQAAVEKCGYELAGEWVEGKEFKSLMMSGRYPEAGEASITRLKSFAGFEAGRTGESSATADAMGRVAISSQVLNSSLGNLVQTTEGEGLYNSNNSLSISQEDGVVYRPPTAQKVGFEYALSYTTDYYIASRSRLQCFDSIYLGGGCDVTFEVANPFVDQKSKLQPNMQYRCCPFDHVEGTRYRLYCYCGSSRVVLSDGEPGRFMFSTPNVTSKMTCILNVYKADGSLSPYQGDWAIYEAHVADRGEIGVEITVQSPPENVSPTAGKNFNQLYLHGAEQGQRVTLLQGCRLRPVFTATPATGSELGFADVACHDMKLVEVVEAVQQMYNLRIYTDHASRRVYVMPRDEFYRGDEHDWSDRIDLSAPITVEELAKDERERITLGYRNETDGAVTRWNASAESRFGDWTFSVESCAALRGEQRVRNPLFSPTLSVAPYAKTPSANVLQVGDRDADQVGAVSARVVRYQGLRALPSGQRWGFPYYVEQYPYAAFHSPEEFTLCFEDRDGCTGLHSYYDNELREKSLRQRLRVTLRLTPLQLSSLAEWESEEANLRSTFVLNLVGQRAKYHLEAVESYDVAQGRAVCRFIRTLND